MEKEALNFRVVKIARQLFARRYCPVCNNKVLSFLPLSSHYKEMFERHGRDWSPGRAETCNAKNYQCPVCGSSDRDRLYAIYLLDWFKRQVGGSSMTFLDIAPSRPLSAFIRAQIKAGGHDCSYITADLFMDWVDLKLDITDMVDVASESLDFILCSHVLEHVSDDRKAMSEICRVLKRDGKCIVMVPLIEGIEQIDEDLSVADEGERWRRFGQGDHVRQYSKKGFVERLQGAGLSVAMLGRNYFGKEIFNKCAITDKSILYIVKRRIG